MYGVTMELSDEAVSPDFLIPIGKAKIERAGKDKVYSCSVNNTIKLTLMNSYFLIVLFLKTEPNIIYGCLI